MSVPRGSTEVIIIIIKITIIIIIIINGSTIIICNHNNYIYFTSLYIIFSFRFHFRETTNDQLKDENSEKYKKISTVLKEQVQLTREVQYQI